VAITGSTRTADAGLKRHCGVPVKALFEGGRRRADARKTVRYRARYVGRR
jgi:hypothetical protein